MPNYIAFPRTSDGKHIIIHKEHIVAIEVVDKNTTTLVLSGGAQYTFSINVIELSRIIGSELGNQTVNKIKRDVSDIDS